MSDFSSLNTQRLFDVSGLVVLVTGGGSGIGAMIARGLASNGAIVYIGGRRLLSVQSVANNFNETGAKGKLIPVHMDVTEKESILKVLDIITSEQGQLHALINNAGQAGTGVPFKVNPDATPAETGRALFDKVSFKDWTDLATINTAAVYFTTTAFTGLLAKGAEGRDGGSSVINIGSSMSQLKVGCGYIPYAGSKAALDHVSKIFANEFSEADIKIRVNVIAPGLFPTEINGHEDRPFTPEDLAQLFGGHRGLRFKGTRGGSPSDIVSSTILLVSSGGAYINGQVINVDGGVLSINPATSA